MRTKRAIQLKIKEVEKLKPFNELEIWCKIGSLNALQWVLTDT